MSVYRLNNVHILIYPAAFWWLVLSPIAAAMDWFTPIWIAGGLGLMGLWLSRSPLGLKSLSMYILTLVFLGLGTIATATCFYHAIPTDSQLSNPQTPKLYFQILLGFRICMAAAVVGGILQIFRFGSMGLEWISGTNNQINQGQG